MNLRGGVEVPTGGNAFVFFKEINDEPASGGAQMGGKADSGESPEPTVIVRMVEDSSRPLSLM